MATCLVSLALAAIFLIACGGAEASARPGANGPAAQALSLGSRPPVTTASSRFNFHIWINLPLGNFMYAAPTVAALWTGSAWQYASVKRTSKWYGLWASASDCTFTWANGNNWYWVAAYFKPEFAVTRPGWYKRWVYIPKSGSVADIMFQTREWWSN